MDELSKIKGNRYDYEMNQLTSFQLRQYKIHCLPIEVIYLDNNSRSHFSQFKDTVKIHSKIIFKGLPALICLAGLITSLLVLYNFELSFYHLTVLAAYFIIELLYLALYAIVQPSQQPGKRVLKETLFTLIKASFVFGMMWLFVNVVGLTYKAAIPVFIIVACLFNLLIPYLFRKK